MKRQPLNKAITIATNKCGYLGQVKLRAAWLCWFWCGFVYFRNAVYNLSLDGLKLNQVGDRQTHLWGSSISVVTRSFKSWERFSFDPSSGKGKQIWDRMTLWWSVCLSDVFSYNWQTRVALSHLVCLPNCIDATRYGLTTLRYASIRPTELSRNESLMIRPETRSKRDPVSHRSLSFSTRYVSSVRLNGRQEMRENCSLVPLFIILICFHGRLEARLPKRNSN